MFHDISFYFMIFPHLSSPNDGASDPSPKAFSSEPHHLATCGGDVRIPETGVSCQLVEIIFQPRKKLVWNSIDQYFYRHFWSRLAGDFDLLGFYTVAAVSGTVLVIYLET